MAKRNVNYVAEVKPHFGQIGLTQWKQVHIMNQGRDKEKLCRWCVRRLQEQWLIRRVSEHARTPKFKQTKLHPSKRMCENPFLP
jgi:hypothetical protein